MTDASSPKHADAAPAIAARRGWMAVLAKARPESLERAWRDMADKPDYRLLRPAEAGLVMVRGRAGGTGQRFNLGEMTVTRCSVMLSDSRTGLAYIAGRNPRHAELAALFDALLQDDARRGDIERRLLTPERAHLQARRDRDARKAAATKVNFFTMVRGED